MVSSVNALPSISLSSPLPRPTAVSNAIHAVTTPSASVGSSVTRNPVGRMRRAVSPTRSATPDGPSTVVMFQVNATMSRQ